MMHSMQHGWSNLQEGFQVCIPLKETVGGKPRKRILCASNSSIVNIQLFFTSEEAQELPAPQTT